MILLVYLTAKIIFLTLLNKCISDLTSEVFNSLEDKFILKYKTPGYYEQPLNTTMNSTY